MRDQLGNVVAYHYDAVGRLENLTDGSSQLIVSYQYDELGVWSGRPRQRHLTSTFTAPTTMAVDLRVRPVGQLTHAVFDMNQYTAVERRSTSMTTMAT